MKTIKFTALFLCLFSSHAMIGINQAVQDYLEIEFHSVTKVSELHFLGRNNSCDELVDTYVVGNIASGETAYNCTICIINDGVIATVDTQESYCIRD